MVNVEGLTQLLGKDCYFEYRGEPIYGILTAVDTRFRIATIFSGEIQELEEKHLSEAMLATAVAR